MIYHVAKNGNDKNKGTADAPFLTISRAASVLEERDTVIVHEGVYRETVAPARGARSEHGRITYEAAKGEKVVVTGAEVVGGWVRDGAVWHTAVENSLFGDYNPFAELIDGDWMQKPLDPETGKSLRHTGSVYIGGDGLNEVSAREEMLETEMTWMAAVNDETTEIWANFGARDAANEEVEISVRKTCFCPEKTGVNYITVRGFEFCRVANPWSPPTSGQMGAVNVNWAKGWIIEENTVHSAKTCGICVGKYASVNDQLYNRYHRKAGYVYQMEAVFEALDMGWCRENIGSHIIRNNRIYDCGQNGIVGHMGGAFSEIYGNDISGIGRRHEYYGYEIAGIKLHAALDTQIHHNHIHDCTMGTWLDWQAQGIHLYANLYHHNTSDLWLEVTHGPCLVDNNIFGSKQSLLNAAQGTAYVHNLFLGGIYKYKVLQRSTPYHLPHSTKIKGFSLTYGGDERFYNNIFANTMGEENERYKLGTGTMYEGFSDSMEEYISTVMSKYGKGDVEYYEREEQPVFMAHNYYGDGVSVYERDVTSVKTELATEAVITEEEGGVYLEMTLDEGFDGIKAEVITTEKLGMPRIVEALYENPDGTPIRIAYDMLGAKRGKNPTAGPVEGIRSGKVRVKVR